jgi:peroxiredoxin
MNKHTLLVLTALLLPLLCGPNLFSAEADKPAADAGQTSASPQDASAMADLKDLVARINDKITHDKTNESDLADNLKEFDALVAKHKDAKPEIRARILSMKAQLYMQVLGEPEKALVVFKQIKTDFPGTQINGNTDEVISDLQDMVAKKKIQDALAPGAPFPDFHETDVDGQPLSISQYKGKVVLVDFWATWCAPCIVKLPEIQAAYAKFHDQGFEVVGVSLDVEKDRLEQFIKEKKMPWPEFFDGKRWDNKLAVQYGVDMTPTGYLIGRDGKVITKLSGDENLDTEIAQALKK